MKKSTKTKTDKKPSPKAPKKKVPVVPKRQQKVGHGLFEKQKPGAEEEKHVEVRLQLDKEPRPPGEEDEINVKLDITVDPENPDEKPLATEVKAKVP